MISIFRSSSVGSTAGTDPDVDAGELEHPVAPVVGLEHVGLVGGDGL
jgi:hypothetical protein